MKTHLVALCALLLPAGLAAQQAGGSAPADPITAGFRGRITGLHRNIAQAFDSIPASKFSYKPTPAQFTIGYVAQHVASDNYLFCNAFGDMKASLSDKETGTPDSVKATWPRDTLIAQLKASFDFCDKAFAQLSDASLGETVALTFGGNTRNIPRINMVLGHALDLADHYSQLANYMRLNGILPPTALPRPGRGGE
jgi:uncharacterized protein YdeI (BOF family)